MIVISYSCLCKSQLPTANSFLPLPKIFHPSSLCRISFSYYHLLPELHLTLLPYISLSKILCLLVSFLKTNSFLAFSLIFSKQIRRELENKIHTSKGHGNYSPVPRGERRSGSKYPTPSSVFLKDRKRQTQIMS